MTTAEPTMLTNKLEILDEDAEDAEDIFEQSLFTIFADSRNQHGEPGQYVIYKSSQFGDIKLRLADPNPSENSLFSHFLWNVSTEDVSFLGNGLIAFGILVGLQAAEMLTDGEFDVKDRTVLELGAGAALPGILSVLCGATKVNIAPISPALILTTTDLVDCSFGLSRPRNIIKHSEQLKGKYPGSPAIQGISCWSHMGRARR
jgi:hypothetical protein